MHYFYVFSSFAIILTRRRGLVALFLLSFRCIVTVNVLWLLTVLWDGLQCVIVVFPDHTHLLFALAKYHVFIKVVYKHSQ